MQVNRPQGFRQLVTLYLMPFDISNEDIQEMANNWGNVKHYEFGKHKKCPIIPIFIFLLKIKKKRMCPTPSILETDSSQSV